MSTYDDSSLFLYPSGYKASVLFAQKPMDANGQLAFTRSNDTATRVASNGLIERVRTNLLTYSNDFSNVAWGKTNVTITSGQEDPFGGTTGWRYLMTVVGNSFVVQNNRTISGAEMTLSFWVKSNTGSNQSFQATANTGSQASPSFTATTSWQRFSWTFTSNANGNVVLAYSPSINCDLLVYGAQLETGVMTDYIPTVAAAVSVGPVANIPRIDYLGGGCGKLLLEPQQTNLALFSEQLDNAAWSKSNTSVTANSATSPDGYQNAELITETTTNGVHFCGYVQASVTSGTTYTTSVFLKKTTGSPDWMQVAYSTTGLAGFANFNLSTGAVGNVISGGSAKIENYGNGWYRCSLTQTANATGTGGGPVIVFTNNTNPNQRFVTYAGSTSVSILAWGGQLEQGSYASSYVNTLSASVTRGADACSKTGISSLIGQTEGTLFVDITTTNDITTVTPIGISDGTSSNRVLLYVGSGILNALVTVSGVAQATITSSSISANTRYKMAIAYKANDFAFYVNGVQIGTDTNGTVPACSKFGYDNGPGTTIFNGLNSQALLFTTRLPNSELASLTAL